MPLMSETRPGFRMTAPEVYAALGLDPKKHLPKEGVLVQTIQGYRVYVLSEYSMNIINEYRNARRAKGAKKMARAMKRTFVTCKNCCRIIEFGHLHQHEDVCDGK